MLYFKHQKISAAILDMDGTLVDSLSFFYQLLSRCLKDHQLPPIPRTTLYNGLGQYLHPREILHAHIPESRRDHLSEKIADKATLQFKKEEAHIPLLPGVRQVFAFLKDEGIQLGLATGRTSGHLREWDFLKKRKLDSFVNSIVTSAEVKKRKPEPDLIIECARLMNVPVNECLAVGDAASDVTAARSAGVIPIAVTTGIDTADELKKQNPAAMLNRLDELINLFARK